MHWNGQAPICGDHCSTLPDALTSLNTALEDDAANLSEVLNFVEYGGDPPLDDESVNGSPIMSTDDLRAWDGCAQAAITGYMAGTTIHDEPQIYVRRIAQLAATLADAMMLERVERVESLYSFREAGLESQRRSRLEWKRPEPAWIQRTIQGMARLIAARLNNRAYSRRHLRLVRGRRTHTKDTEMKVINKGKIPEPPKAWWVGQIMKCGKCGWTAELEAVDAHLIKDISERRPGGRRQVGCICQTCADALLQDEVVMRGS